MTDTWFTNYEDPLEDPLREWLLANNIDYEQIVLWTDIEVDEEARTLTVENIRSGYSTMRDGVTPKTAFIFGQAVTRKVTLPLLVYPPPGLLDMYRHARRQAIGRETLLALGKAGASVVHVGCGDRLLFLVRDQMTQKETDEMQKQLRQLFPAEVDVTVITGAFAVIGTRANPHLRDVT